MRVFVYFNLHSKRWSIKALDGGYKGRVVAHASHVELTDCTLKVSEAGRQRVLREKRKNVHAGVVGTLGSLVGNARIGAECTLPNGPVVLQGLDAVPVSYNPYKAPTFVRRDNGEPVLAADRVVLTATGAFAHGVR